MSSDILVQIPCLNEESTIGHVVKIFKKKLPKATIIVYDNNSSDKSVILAKKNGAKVIMVKREEREMLCGECLKKIQKQNILL